MSRRRTKLWNEGHELSHYVITHYVDDVVVRDKNGGVVVIQGEPGTGKTALARLFVEGKLEQGVDFVSSNPPWASPARNATLRLPQLAELLMLLLPMKYRENLIGCAEEEYWTRSLPRFGARKARLIFWTQAIDAWLVFLARPLAGIAGLAWIGKIIEALVSKLLK